MMEESIFTKIIKGDIPAHKVYEDDKVLAFLDIMPESAGHTLVIPKIEVDKVYDLPEEYWQAVWDAVRKLSQHYEKVLGVRILYKVIGVDVPHAHVHVVPFDPHYDVAKDRHLERADDADLVAMAEKLRL